MFSTSALSILIHTAHSIESPPITNNAKVEVRMMG